MKIDTTKLQPTSVHGIISWNPSIYDRFEENDIVLYNHKLYVVKADTETIESNEITPELDNGSYYEEYIRQLSIKSTSEMVNDGINRNLFMPVDMIPELMNTYIKGLNPLGVVSKLNNIDLNDIVSTSMYMIDQESMNGGTIGHAPISLISSPESRHLFRSFKDSTNEGYIIQEWIDIDNTVVYYRHNNDSSSESGWSNWKALFGTSQTANEIYDLLNNSIHKASEYYDKVYKTLVTYNEYFSYMDITNPLCWSEIGSFPYTWSSGSLITWNQLPDELNLMFNIVKLVVSYELNGYTVQETIPIYLNMIDGAGLSYRVYNRNQTFFIDIQINLNTITFSLGGSLSSVTLNRVLANTKKSFIKISE